MNTRVFMSMGKKQAYTIAQCINGGKIKTFGVCPCCLPYFNQDLLIVSQFIA